MNKKYSFCIQSLITNQFRSDLPECIEEDLKIIEDYFTEIDDLISTWIMRIAGQDQVEWKVDERSFELDQKLFKVLFISKVD